jgi:signal transduction histidine kinase
MTAEQPLPQALSLAAHELRTPLTVVSGYVRMLLQGNFGALDERQREMLENAAGSCAKMSAFVDEMSEFAKLGDGRLALTQQPFDIAALLSELAADMHEGRDRGVRLETRGCDRPVIVCGDRPRLGKALAALMHAALREQGPPGVIAVECSTAADRVLVTVSDPALAASLRNGPTLTPAFADEWWGGTGFSRPMARWIIEAHGGALWSAGARQLRGAVGIRLPLGNRPKGIDR